MILSEGQKNCLLNILNVLAHISNEKYIIKCWNSDTINLLSAGKLSAVDVCNTIVFNCREALNILEDNNFYDLVDTDFGYWQEFVEALNEKTFSSLIAVCEQILFFIDNNNIDLNGIELMKSHHWINVLKLSKIAFENLREDLNESERGYLF